MSAFFPLARERERDGVRVGEGQTGVREDSLIMH